MKRALLVTACLMLTVVAWSQDEDKYKEWMQTAGATVGSLQKNLKARNGEAASADAHKLHMVFGEVHGFWQKKNVDDAMKFAMDASEGFHKVAEQASAGHFDEASATLKATTASCGGCHSAHREKTADGSFKIKY
jgi:hypothetical protein